MVGVADIMGGPMRLHTIKGDGRRVMCGPGAISAITGKDVADVKAMVYKVKGVRYVCRMSNGHMISTLLRFGYRIRSRAEFNPKPTLARWLKSRAPGKLNSVYLVRLRGHFMVVKGRKAIDNMTVDPVFIRQAPNRRARVHIVWEIIEDRRRRAIPIG